MCKESFPKEIRAGLSEMKKLHIVLQREIFMRMIEFMSRQKKGYNRKAYRLSYEAAKRSDREKNRPPIRYNCCKIL